MEEQHDFGQTRLKSCSKGSTSAIYLYLYVTTILEFDQISCWRKDLAHIIDPGFVRSLEIGSGCMNLVLQTIVSSNWSY